MASAFAHALVAITIGKTYTKELTSAKFWLLGCFCAVIPDADVLMLNFVDYGHVLGHRGFFHSLFFCFLLAALVTKLFYRNENLLGKKGLTLLFFFFLCGASHALLDMLTNGGKGVAIFAPFDNARYFFPCRPVKVSPIGVAKFFSERGLRVIKSEAVWIGIPCVLYIIAMTFVKHKKA